MSKKLKALQITAFLTAVSGATIISAATSTTVQAAENKLWQERCWDRKNSVSEDRDRLRGCLYEQYGLRGDGGDIDGTDTGGGGGGGVDPGPGPAPGPYGP